MTKATNAAVEQSKILQGQLTEMRETRKLAERAWVFPYKVQMRTNEIEHEYIFEVVFKNSGQSPAIRTKIRFGHAAGVNPDFIPNSDPEPTNGSGMIAPGAEIFDRTAVPISEVTNWIGSGRNLYLFGTIWYNDIFGIRHWTQYCVQASKNLKAFGPVQRHNQCDEN